jgi:UDP-glucose 4-epimerase
LTYYFNNVVATISLLQIMSDYDCTRVVYSSSATVYGTPPEIPIPETTRLRADSPYGTTKIMCEQIIEDLCHCEWSCVSSSGAWLITAYDTAEPKRWRAISLRYFKCVCDLRHVQ